MIDTKYPTDAFEDAIEATAYMATALLRRGELLLPPRIREHIADGVVVVHLLRGEEDVAVCEATLTSESKLSGIDWPADVLPRTSLTVLCPRGGASHDIGVVLPELEPTVTFLGPVPDEPTAEPEPVTDEQLAAITGALTALADAAPVIEVAQPGPAEYEVPTTLRPADRDWQDDVEEDAAVAIPHDWREIDARVIRENAPTETIAAVPADGWPAEKLDSGYLVEHLAVFEEEPAEQTAIVPAVGELEVLDLDRDYRPRWRRALAWWFHVVAFFSFVVSEVAYAIRLSARWEVEHDRTLARLVVAGLSFLVLAAAGVLWLLLEVTR